MKRILVVEDELSLSEVLENGLKDLGYEVMTAENGKVGLDIALKQHPDLIITDILMPEMDGMKMLTDLRADEEFGSKVKVIILTNLEPDTSIITEAIKDHPSYFLEKANSSLEVIFQMVKKLLDDEKKNLDQEEKKTEDNM